MRIVQIYHHDPCDKGKGGAVNYLNNLISFLQKKDIEIRLIGTNFVECDKNINYEYTPILNGSNLWWKYFFNLLVTLPFIKMKDTDIIHLHRIEYALPFILWKKNKIVLTLHGERLATAENTYSKLLHPFIKLIYFGIEYITFKKVDYIVAVSNRVKMSYEKIHNLNEKKITIIPVGIDLNKFKPLEKSFLRKKNGINEKTIVILFVGVLGPIKNVKLLIDSFKLFLDSFSDSLLIIVGDGLDKNNLEMQTQNLKIQNNVSFVGEIKNEKMPEFYSLADIMAFPSNSEGAGIVIREALACGIPIVSTDVGDVSDIINSNDDIGIIVNSDRINFLQGIQIVFEKLNKNPEKVKEKCIETAQITSFERVVEEYITIFQKLNGSELS